MWIVRLALRRPYTFVVMAMAVTLLGILAILRMPTDIFPEVDIPVISVVWQYNGMSAGEMESRMVRLFEGFLTTVVNDIEHIESQSLNGVAVIRVYFHPGARIEEAEAQVTAAGQTALRQMPLGSNPPLILRYSASTVPILQLSMGSDTLSEQQLFDIAAQSFRTELATVQGAMIPWPYGGKQRYIVVDLEPDKLFGYGLSAAAATLTVKMPGTLRPWQEVSIFARTTGYLKKYYVDISNDVTAGQLMAEIDAPEVDQELDQSKAAQLQAQAAVTKATTDRDLAKVTLDRYQSLKETHSIAPQDLDEKQSACDAAIAALAQAKANLAAAEANVRRLTELQSFEKVVAPFSGVVTGRAYDVGSYIMGNPTGVDIKPMYKIAENDILRAFVNVPQSNALQIKKGMEVEVTVRERPGRVYKGNVMGTTNYLDPANRSLLTEVKIPNPQEPDGRFSLLPGMFCEAGFNVTRDQAPLLIPAPALVTNAEGTQVAVVRDGKAHFQTITLGPDHGTEIEVVAGLNGDEQIIANPGERIAEGVAVATATPAAGATDGSRSAQADAGVQSPSSPRVKVSEATKE
jgi:RND family efflux transporter MFP subunit